MELNSTKIVHNDKETFMLSIIFWRYGLSDVIFVNNRLEFFGQELCCG